MSDDVGSTCKLSSAVSWLLLVLLLMLWVADGIEEGGMDNKNYILMIVLQRTSFSLLLSLLFHSSLGSEFECMNE